MSDDDIDKKPVRKKSPLVVLDLMIVVMAVAGLYLVIKPLVLHWQQDRLTRQLLAAYEQGNAVIEIDPNAYKVEGEETEFNGAYETSPAATDPAVTGSDMETTETGSTAETGETGPTTAFTLPSKPGGTVKTEPTQTTAAPAPAPVKVKIQAIGRITIAKIAVDMPIAEGSTLANLRVAIGHHSKTPAIGQPGLSVLFGHRMYSYGRHFNRLGEVAVNDTFTIEDKQNRYTYTIRQIDRVLPADLPNEMYRQVEGSWVMLVTCDPVRVASHRLLVKAEVTAIEALP